MAPTRHTPSAVRDADATLASRSGAAGRGSAPFLWGGGAVAVSLLMLVATAASWFETGSPALDRIAGELGLASENNVAAWWSGILFLVAGLHMLDGAFRGRRAGSAAAGPWAVLGGVLVLFSVDEIGSLHERLSIAAEAVGVSKWVAFGVVGLVGAAVVFRSLAGLWRQGERAAVRRMTIAFGLLASVVGQEVIEHMIRWEGPAEMALRSVIEEGTELAAVLVFLWVGMRHTTGLGVVDSPGEQQPFASLRALRLPELAVVVVACVVVAVPTAMIADHRGKPADWLAAAILACASLYALRPLLLRRAAPLGARPATLALLAAFGSAVAVGVRPGYAKAIGGIEVNLRLGLLAVLAAALVAAAPGALRPSRTLAVLAAALLTVVAGAVTSQTPNAIFLATPLFALAAYDAVTTAGGNTRTG